MSNNDNNTYVLVRDSNGEKFLCPLNTNQVPLSINADEMVDCFEEDVVGRYAGNIKTRVP